MLRNWPKSKVCPVGPGALRAIFDQLSKPLVIEGTFDPRMIDEVLSFELQSCRS